MDYYRVSEQKTNETIEEYSGWGARFVVRAAETRDVSNWNRSLKASILHLCVA